MRSQSTSVAPKFPEVTSHPHHRELNRTNSDTRSSAPINSSPVQNSNSSGATLSNSSQTSPPVMINTESLKARKLTDD